MMEQLFTARRERERTERDPEGEAGEVERRPQAVPGKITGFRLAHVQKSVGVYRPSLQRLQVSIEPCKERAKWVVKPNRTFWLENSARMRVFCAIR